MFIPLHQFQVDHSCQVEKMENDERMIDERKDGEQEKSKFKT